MSDGKLGISGLKVEITRLPTEIANQIIDDLRVWDVLRLILLRDFLLDKRIMLHPICRNMFGADKEALSKWQFAVTVYREIFTAVKKPMVAPSSIRRNPLGTNIHCIDPADYPDIWDYLRHRIHDEIALHWRKADLTRFGAESHTNEHAHRPWTLKIHETFEELRDCWEDIQKAKANSYHLRAEELYWIADMLEANPDILKRTLDPEQAHRPNTTHILSRMRRSADGIMRGSARRFFAGEHFRYDFLGVIPFDSALSQLLDMMQKHGLMEADGGVASETMNSAGTASHPSSIMDSVRTVIDGMPKFYLLPAGWPDLRSIPRHKNAALVDGELLRTVNTPWSEQFPGNGAVSFKGPHFTTLKYGDHKSFWRPKSLFWIPILIWRKYGSSLLLRFIGT
ncbi:hypothetical protein PENANT_c016G02933 [Penicillium antarcticum]|uniref:Uncharacterized protein n=1 Tax=Penicillium antarcticum TaxID=416450 RepID=A0A1V6Q2X8_9EURO|nr:hypothetical protein PENANT_c016G02933 [Penicillium antarcticum]